VNGFFLNQNGITIHFADSADYPQQIINSYCCCGFKNGKSV